MHGWERQGMGCGAAVNRLFLGWERWDVISFVAQILGKKVQSVLCLFCGFAFGGIGSKLLLTWRN